MRKVVEYKIQRNSAERLQTQVKDLLSQGWELFGPPTHDPARGEHWAQALVRYDDVGDGMLPEVHYICTDSVGELYAAVTRRIAEGWNPLGGLVVSVDQEGSKEYIQTMRRN